MTDKIVIRADDGGLELIADDGRADVVYGSANGYEIVVILEGAVYVVVDGEGEVIETLTRSE